MSNTSVGQESMPGRACTAKHPLPTQGCMGSASERYYSQEEAYAGTCTRTPSLAGARMAPAFCFSCSCWYQVLALRLPMRPRPYSSLQQRISQSL